jgi:CubicO group peptidase (beta-lactamase class C family)
MKLRVAVVSLLSALLTSLAMGQQKPPENLQPIIDQLDTTAAELVKDPNAASFTIGLVQKSGLVWTKSYGYADIANKKPANADSVYRIGSITKQFTALMLLQLVRDGKVHFSDPVEKYFPEIHQVTGEYKNAPPITLVQLATHTSGLDREPADTQTYVKGPVSDWVKILISALPHTKYLYEPGTRFSYSNVGYAILGATLSRAAHQPYTDYVKEKILLPLGMTHSDFEATPAIRQNLAIGYNMDEKLDAETAEKEHQSGRGYKVPNGALYTTVGDLAKFEQFEMLGGPENVLSKKELEENAHRLVAADRDLTSGYGIGFLIQRNEGRIFVGHSGAVSGYLATAMFQPTAETGIIILHNELSPGMEKLMQAFMKILPVKNQPENGGH